MKYLFILISCVFISAQAEVYRWVEDNGTVVFSDQSHPDAEEVIIDSSPSYTSQEIPVQEIPEEIVEGNDDVPDYEISIVYPENDTTVRENSGTVTIVVNIIPELSPERADLIIVKMDGQTLGEPQASTSFTLTNVDRGTHTAQVSIVDKSGTELISSDITSFHLQRVSAAR